IIQQAWRRRGDGLYERARHNAAKVIQSYYRGYLARRQNPDLAQYMAGRMVIPQDEEKEEQPKELTDLEILRLEIPSDLAYVLEERSNGKFLQLFPMQPGGKQHHFKTTNTHNNSEPSYFQ
ncbi:hypothetical protein AHF37_06343, partial [Paragonimus kellicotti]